MALSPLATTRPFVRGRADELPAPSCSRRGGQDGGQCGWGWRGPRPGAALPGRPHLARTTHGGGAVGVAWGAPARRLGLGPRAAAGEGEGAGASSEGASALDQIEEESPWNVTEYISKRTRRETGPLGQLKEDEDLVDLVDLPGWTAENQMRMVIGIVAREAGVEPEYVAMQMDKLRTLLPDLEGEGRFETMPPGQLARMALDADGIALKLIALRDLFPRANISRMVALRPSVLQRSVPELEEAAATVREVLVEKEGGEPWVDRLIETHPMYLEVNLRRCAAEIELLFSKPAWEMFKGDPSILLSVQRAGDMIEQHVGEYQSGARPTGYQDWA